jgi:nucleotide-binding universal stress UspA family protein
MDQDSKLIIVPWDFSPMAENALLHAIKIAKNVDNHIELLHIVKSGTNPAIKEANVIRLDKRAEEIEEQHGIKPTTLILEGSIFTKISEYSTDRGANLVVMGTHGRKGMQKVTGSWALKVIVGSKVPFLVIKNKPADMEKYNHIVFPVDFRSENKEKLYMAIYMGKYFDSKVHILKAPITDKSLLKKTNTNLNFAIKFLIQNNIAYELHETRKSSSFPKETIEFAKQIKADLILIMTTKHINIGDYALGASEQQIIDNSANIPVMCINPKANYAKVAQYMYG